MTANINNVFCSPFHFNGISWAVLVPLLQKFDSQQSVHEIILLRSPITMQSGSHLLVQFLSMYHNFDTGVLVLLVV